MHFQRKMSSNDVVVQTCFTVCSSLNLLQCSKCELGLPPISTNPHSSGADFSLPSPRNAQLHHDSLISQLLYRLCETCSWHPGEYQNRSGSPNGYCSVCQIGFSGENHICTIKLATRNYHLRRFHLVPSLFVVS